MSVNSPRPTTFRRRPLAAALALALAAQPAISWAQASLSLVAFAGDAPLANAVVRVDGEALCTTDSDGACLLTVAEGSHELVIESATKVVVSTTLDLVDGEVAQLIATVYPDEPDTAPSIFLESSESVAATSDSPGDDSVEAAGLDAPPGRLAGRITAAETGAPIADARVFVSGLPLDIRTGADGRFDVEVPAGSWSVSVLAPEFASATREGVEIETASTRSLDLELTPAGVELAEFIVIEPFVEGSLASFVEERRTSANVADVLGAEQISRAGDSDAASALKRVTGLSLVDDRFIYVRGLGERYSSTLLNGAQVPSPDPTRKVVPLDLFPTEILSGILVQKTWSADMPAEFGGGTVQLRTRGLPDAFLFRTSVGLTYADGTTGEDGLRYDGGRRDFTGVDDGSREAPNGLLEPRLPTDPQALERLGDELAARGLAITPGSLGPSGNASVALGNRMDMADGAWSFGWLAAVRYAHEWDNREEIRRNFGQIAGELFPDTDFERTRTNRDIDVSAFVAAGVEIGEQHEITLNLLDLRQTSDEARIDRGILGSGEFEQQYLLEWVENELRANQLTGKHSFPGLAGLVWDWQFTRSTANRDAPNTRQYRASADADSDVVAISSFGEQFRFENLEDNSREWRTSAMLPFELGDTNSLNVTVGAGQLKRDRQSSIRRFEFQGRTPPGSFENPEDLFNPDFIGADPRQSLVLRSIGLSTDVYTATVDLKSLFATADLTLGDWRATLGVRDEDILQQVITLSPFLPNPTPVIGEVDTRDLLPSAALTWAYSDAAQFRFGYSETVSRPDLREQSEADFSDPLLDVTVKGNPDLVPTAIEHLDLRWEYYFSPTESFSIAAFRKQFADPIELVATPASGFLLTIQNAEAATNTGVEFDLYTNFDRLLPARLRPGFLAALPWDELFLGANYAWIESEIDLGDNQGIQTNGVRPLQGQSPWVANVVLSWLPADGDFEATLLYNSFGARIQRVGVLGVPDSLEQPFNQLDFTLKAKLPWDGWSARLKLRNILDDSVELTVGDQTAISYDKGREVGLSIEWRP